MNTPTKRDAASLKERVSVCERTLVEGNQLSERVREREGAMGKEGDGHNPSILFPCKFTLIVLIDIMW